MESFEIRDLREKGFFRVDDLYLNGWAKLCGPYASLVYFAMCRHADNNQSCFPSVSLIGKKLNVSDRQVIRALKTLESFHIIQTRRTTGKSNLYFLLDKKHWLTTPMTNSHQCLIVTTPMTNSHHTHDCQSLEPMTNSHHKETHIRKHIKGNMSEVQNDLFGQFYKAYPRRVKKERAKKAWDKIKPVPDETLLNKMISIIEQQKKSFDWQKDNGQYIPHPATWLNDKRWEDEIQNPQGEAAAQDGYFTKL